MTSYLDYAATAPIRTEVIDSYAQDLRLLSQNPGNPNALHAAGRAAREMLEDARKRVADSLGADAAEVVFTSGATESNSLTVLGALKAAEEAGQTPVFLTDGLEHPAIAKLGDRCRENGGQVLIAKVDELGLIDTADVERLCSENQVSVAAFMAVSNEVGTIQPVKELAEIAHRHGVKHVHCDAAQAVGHIEVDFHEWGVESLAFSGHKIGAPGGIGVLLIKRAIAVVSDRIGGGQERSLRSGTQNVAGARALASALEIADATRAEETSLMLQLRAQLIAGLDPRATVTKVGQTSPHIVHLTLPTEHPEVILMMMDQAGVAVSAASACAAGVPRPSAALLAMGRSEAEAMGALRVSLGWDSTSEDIAAFLAALGSALDAAARFEKGRN
ncbi:cysteine desulfurase family protein [Boudabousia marimammalium]|uniref:Aminotransferase class V domain-containing protein n=1 Tax=Boudabousia marimammalium TaxID=156892 RepID=A0A1Q5PRF5_9ACTO|nr:cysteine desulfurase family protein [Boudabousia marimammalium]OKL50147.1 hypothetical protein BM477_01755 [Boudabousia marimammalium]